MRQGGMGPRLREDGVLAQRANKKTASEDAVLVLQ
jgi:hypothetical protein